jgi:DNA-binding MarR family transcriptional regulator
MRSDPGVSRAAEAWRLMFDLLMRSVPDRLESLEKRGLTPNDARALSTLDPQGRPIGELARLWRCDPSTATWLVDRLERAGLAKRLASPQDRRIKLIRLTPKGRATMDELMQEYHRPPPAMAALCAGELDDLIRLLGKLQGGAGEVSPPD